MDIKTIATLVIFAMAVLDVLIGMSKGRKKPLKKTVARIISVVLSAVSAVITSRIISGKLGEVLYSALGEEIFTDELAGIPQAIPSIEGVFHALVSILACPIIFMVLFAVFRIIFSIISAIILAILKPKLYPNAGESTTQKTESDAKKTDDELHSENDTSDEQNDPIEDKPIEEKKAKKPAGIRGKKAIGMAIGALCGLVIFVASWAPITGTIAIFDNIVRNLELEDEEDFEDIKPFITAISDNTAIKFTNSIGGHLIYNALTTAKIGDVKITLAKESETLGACVRAITILSDEESKSSTQANAIRNISSAFDNSTLLPIIASDFICAAADAFCNGEDFLGISIDLEDGVMSELIAGVMSAFKNSTPDTVKEDVGTIIEIAALLIENEVIGDGADTDPSQLLANEAFVKPLLLEMLDNQRMSAVVNDGINLFVKFLVTDALGAPTSKDELYRMFLEDFAQIDTADAANVKKVFDKYGITIKDASAEAIAEDLASITLDTSNTGAIQSILDSRAVAIILSDKSEVSVNINSVQNLASFTVITTSDSLKTESHPITNPEAEVSILVDAIAVIPNLAESLENDTADISHLMSSIGILLDKFSESKLIGKECTDTLVLIIFQSDAISDVLPISRVSVISAAKSIIRGAENKSYEQIMTELANTLEALISLSESENLKDDDSVKNLLTTITPESAEVIEHMIDSELVSTLGVSEKSAESLSNMVSSTLNKLADAQTDENFDEVEYNKEIESITYLITTAIDVSKNSSENIEINISDYVDTIFSSEIVTSTILESVYGDGDTAVVNPLDIEYEPTTEEKVELADALTEKLNSVSDEERAEIEKTITAIAGLINVEILITEDGVKLP